jgi:hypothetical protein
MAAKRKRRIVHLPTDLGMRGYSLSRAEQAQGLDSTFVVRVASVHQSGAARPLRTGNRLVSAWRWLRALVRVLRADVVMANSGASLVDFPRVGVHLADVPVYRALGKRVVVTFQGCDVRPCDGCPVRAALPAGETCLNVPAGSTYASFDAYKAERLGRWKGGAHAILGITPDLCRTEGVRYTPHAKWMEESAPPPRAPRAPGDPRPLRVAHMPKAHIKGSEWVEPRLRELCEERPGQVEYVPIAGLGWAEAMSLLTSCDVLVDQVLMGWYGGISVEAALLGVVPIAWVDPEVLGHVDPALAANLPVLALDRKEDLLPALRRLLDDPHALRAEAERCHRSARANHDASVVAAQLAREHYQVPARSA